jgi:hypothetical protein
MGGDSSAAQQGGNDSFVPINGANTLDTPANALSGSTFGSPVDQDGPFLVGGTGNSSSGSQAASPSVTAGVPSSSGFALSLPEMLMLAGAALLVVWLVKRHG